MQQFHTLKADVTLLQETHFPATYQPTFLHKNFAHFHLANAVNKTRGVAVCFSNKVHFSHSKTIKDPDGHYILVTGTINGVSYTFVSYYASNTHHNKFFKTTLRTLKPHFLGTVILGGDSNTPFDLSSDKSNPLKPKTKRPPKTQSSGCSDLTILWPDRHLGGR